MTALSIPQFTIADTIISIVDGLYSLNDLHKASGGEAKHKPSNFMRNEETKAMISEIESEYSDAQIRASSENKAFRVIKGNFGSVKQGTYVCKELVYRYAMWISPKFALIVIRTFDALVSRSDAKQRECLISACDKLAVGNTLRSDVYTQVANHFGYDKPSQIPTPLLPEAVAYVYELMLASKSKTPSFNKVYAENVGQLVRHMYHINSWFKSVRVPLGMLNPALVTEISGHMVQGAFSAQIINGQIAERFDPMISNTVRWQVSDQ